MTQEVLVDIRDLTVEYVSSGGLFGRRKRRVRVLENFNLKIHRGKTLGIVGESGCGKTTLANSIARFIRSQKGQVLFEGLDIMGMDRRTLREQRRKMQMVFQNPFNSLNPRMNVFQLVKEPLITHTDLRGEKLKTRVKELLEEVGLGTGHMNRYPHQISGGQAQRVALARALALNPKLLFLDEPTSALDVSVQAQIVNLLKKLQADHNLTYMFISHGLGVIQHISNSIAVLYLGEIVELAPRDEIFKSPQHPYTQVLFSSMPVPDPDSGKERVILEGNVPSLSDPPAGCRFHTRCPHMMVVCKKEAPTAHTIQDGHWATCHLLEKEGSGVLSSEVQG
jgi:oligopeptide/dipeptide ABC transporter ATP-binding protein